MGFFLIIFGGLTTPPLQVLFQNWLVMSFAQAETVLHRSLRTPLAVHGLWPVGVAADISPALPDGGQQGRDQGLPTGFAGASRGKQRGKCCWLLSGTTSRPLPSLPRGQQPCSISHPAWHGGGTLCHGCAATGGRGGRRGEEQAAFAQCSLSSHLGTKQFPKIPAFPFPAPLPCRETALPLPTAGPTERRAGVLCSGLSLRTPTARPSLGRAAVKRERSAQALPPAASASGV